MAASALAAIACSVQIGPPEPAGFTSGFVGLNVVCASLELNPVRSAPIVPADAVAVTAPRIDDIDKVDNEAGP